MAQRSSIYLVFTTLVFASGTFGEQVDDYLKAQMVQHRIPGIALQIIQDGKATKTATYGLANLELNVARHVRVATGVGYRFAVAAKGDGPSSGDLSGIVARTSVVFGSF